MYLSYFRLYVDVIKSHIVPHICRLHPTLVSWDLVTVVMIQVPARAGCEGNLLDSNNQQPGSIGVHPRQEKKNGERMHSVVLLIYLKLHMKC